MWSMRKENTAFQHKNRIPSVKHGGESIMVWAYFDASGPGRLAIIDRTINYELYQQIIKENVRISVKEQSLKRKWIIQQRHRHQHTSRPTKEWIKKNKDDVLEWLSQSPDLNPIEMLWKELKQAVHRRKPTNITVEVVNWVIFVYFQDLCENCVMFCVIYTEI